MARRTSKICQHCQGRVGEIYLAMIDKFVCRPCAAEYNEAVIQLEAAINSNEDNPDDLVSLQRKPFPDLF
jgi:hypothetical protein